LVYVTGHGACAPTVAATFDLLIDPRVLPNKLLFGFVCLLLLSSQLLHPYVRWGCCPPFGSATEVAYQSSLLRGDAFDMSLGCFCHETFPGGVMAPPARVRGRVQPQPSMRRSWRDSVILLIIPANSLFAGDGITRCATRWRMVAVALRRPNRRAIKALRAESSKDRVRQHGSSLDGWGLRGTPGWHSSLP
jgi:hypothetical protein